MTSFAPWRVGGDGAAGRPPLPFQTDLVYEAAGIRERSRNTIKYHIDYLPGHTTANLYDFWLDDPGSVHWARALDELARQQQPGAPSQDLMKLQDCFPMFYSKHLDCLKFWRLAKEIRSRGP